VSSLPRSTTYVWGLSVFQWSTATRRQPQVAFLGAGLVALPGVILHELLAQLCNCGSLARHRLVGGRIAAPAHLCQPLLGQGAGLLDGQLPEQAQDGLAPLAGVRAVLEHEHLAARWCNLAQEAGHQRVPEFDGLRLGLHRLNGGFGEFGFCHDDSSKDPFRRGHMGAMRSQAGSGFRKHRHMKKLLKSLINLLYLALA